MVKEILTGAILIMMKYRKLLNIALIVIVLLSWGELSFFHSDSFMSAGNFGSLKYFTILSNLFEAFACAVWLINGNERIKYAASVAVGLTFFTVLFFLGPIFTYRFMFTGPSFYLHGVVPIAAMLEMIFLCKEKIGRRDNLLSCLSMLVYGVYYLGNILVNGIGVPPQNNDWYGFLRWGWGVGIVILFLMTGAIWLIGFGIRKLMRNK